MSQGKKMRIAITMGDPAGVGSEIIVKALSHVEIYKRCIPVVIGDYAALADAIRFCSLPIKLRDVEDVSEAKGEFGHIDFINMKRLRPGEWEYKQNSAKCGEACFQYVIYGIKQAMEGKVYVSEPLISKITGELSIMVAAPLYSEGKHGSQIVGVVYFVPPETFLNDIV